MRFLVDSSVWVDFFNGHPSAEADALGDLLIGDDDICTCGVVVAEVLQGLKRSSSYKQISNGFEDLTFLEPSGLSLYVRAAGIYRTLRGRGETVRSTIDCVIAAIAEENRCHILARDKELRVIIASGFVDLLVWPLPG